MSFARVWRVAAIAGVLCASLFAAQQGLEELKKRLADSDEKVRRGAIEELAKQNGAAALALVVEHLRDPSAMVADQAELALASADEAPELDLLFSKDALGAKDDLVRQRCAEALGRVEAKLATAKLAKGLGDKSPAVRRAVAYSIEQLARRQKLADDPAPALRKELADLAARDPAPGVRAAALMAVATLAPKLTQPEIAGFASDKEYEVRCGALLACDELEVGAKLALAKLALKDANASVRMQAHALLARIANRDAAILLAGALGEEKLARPSWAIVELLRGLSGLKSGREARAWQQWASGLAPDWKPGAPAAQSGDVEPQTATFVGLPLLSDRVTFLIDLSGSMWEERDGKTRKAGADKELEKALGTLAPTTLFNVIPFTATPLPWQKSLQPATPKNVADALAFFVKRHDHGKGNFWDAAQLALEDSQVDTLILLGDGAPTGGTRWNVDLMRTLFTEQNRFRLVKLDAVLVDCSKGLARTWEGWCASTGGRTLATDLR